MNNFRKYENSNTKIEETYMLMLKNQTLEYQKLMKEKYSNYPNLNINTWDIIEKLNSIIDESDPDTDLPQIIHAYQTAQSIKKNYLNENYLLKNNLKIKNLFSENEWKNLPKNIKNIYNTDLDKLYSNILDWDWLYLVGFIHDLGKILLTEKFGNLDQWAVVGDTFPLGQKLDDEYIYENKNFHLNNESLLNNIYNDFCGFESVIMSWGHDEYLASILERNSTNLPKEAIYIIRFHSFYSWHTPKNKQGYINLANNYDWYMLPLLKMFQKADLYSKTKNIPNDNLIKKEFNIIFKKYNIETLSW